MEWISVKTRLPETDSQHGEDFVSDFVGVWTDEGFSADRYIKTYDLRGGTGKKLSEGWLNSEDVTHWMQPTKPNDITCEEEFTDSYMKKVRYPKKKKTIL